MYYPLATSQHHTPSKRAPNAGFSLIELLVSMTIFTLVMVMGVGALLVVVDSNAKAQSLQDVMTNFTFAMDSMTREIRTGRGYYCWSGSSPGSISESATLDCTTNAAISIVEGGSSLTGVGNPRIAYRYNSTDQSIERSLGGGSWLRITPDEVAITTMYFSVAGSTTGDDEQPTVTIYMEGEAGALPGLDSSFAIQSTITKRLLDI